MAPQQILSRIKRLRKDLSLSQADMAASLHIALKTYQNIESGITRIDIERLQQIAQVLSSDITQLLDIVEPERKTAKLTCEAKELYTQIIRDKEAYISQLEESVRFYREILRDSKVYVQQQAV